MSEARPANQERGEIVLSLGEDYVLRPTYEAIAAIEQALDKGLFDIASDAINHRLRLTDCAIVAAECIKAWGRATGGPQTLQAIRPARIAELMLESEGGYKAALEQVAMMLAMACTGGYTASGEPKAATVTSATTTNADTAAA